MIRFFFPESLIVEYIFYQIISDLLCFISLILVKKKVEHGNKTGNKILGI